MDTPAARSSSPDSEQVAWRLLVLNWRLIGLCSGAAFVGMHAAGFSISFAGMQFSPPVIVLLLAAVGSCGYAVVGRRNEFAHYACASFVQFNVAALSLTLLTYVAGSAALPLRDSALAHLDEALGLNWSAFFRFTYERPWLIRADYLAYSALNWQPYVLVYLLSAAAQYARLQRLLFACIVSLALSTIIFTFVPAIGTYHEYATQFDPVRLDPGGYMEQARDLPLVRSGTVQAIDIGSLSGLIAFPSFHATAAVLFAWACWTLPFFRIPAVAVNLAMLFATPVIGGHYFADVFSGMAIAVLAIIASSRVAEALSRSSSKYIAQTAGA